MENDLVEFAEDVAYQFGYYCQNKGRLHITHGGLSTLERAFDILGWENPHPVPECECEIDCCHEHATCGTPTEDGYKIVCYKHWREIQKDLQKEVKELEEKANSLAEAYAEAEDFTLRFLKCCSKHHIKLVSIGKRTSLIESTKRYPFGCEGSVFADGRDRSGWPAIWGIVEEMGVSGGAGNSGQHQVSCDAKLIDGVYEFKDKKWCKNRIRVANNRQQMSC